MTGIMKEFPGVKALDDVSFELYEGEVLAQLNSPQAAILKEVNALYKIAADAMEGLKWIQAK